MSFAEYKDRKYRSNPELRKPGSIKISNAAFIDELSKAYRAGQSDAAEFMRDLSRGSDILSQFSDIFGGHDE